MIRKKFTPLRKAGTALLAGGLAAFGADEALAAMPDLGAAPALDTAGQTAALPAVVLKGTTGLDGDDKKKWPRSAAPASHGTDDQYGVSAADLDGDGDLDLVIGGFYSSASTLRYYENVGSAARPNFVERTGAANPFDGIVLADPFLNIPAFGDLDGDGDFDVVVGGAYGYLQAIKNNGTAISPNMQLMAGPDNPFFGFVPAGSIAQPALGDLDGDTDVDLLLGDGTGTFRYFRNDGGLPPAFTEITGAANPMHGEDVGYYSAPALGDIDGDGDLDVISGSYFAGGLVTYRNVGTAIAPSFNFKGGGGALTLPNQTISNYSSPSLADLDGDGDLDLLATDWYVSLKFYRNIGTPVGPKFNNLKHSPFIPADVSEAGAEEEVVELQWDGDVFAPADEVLPAEVGLEAPYPNPVQGRAWIPFRLPESASVRLAVYDVLGREVARLVDGVEPAGRHQALFDGQGLPAGFYLIKMEAGGREEVRSLVLNR